MDHFAGGGSPGGKAYGYDVVRSEAGERSINPDEATIVRRIFEEFAAGRSPRAIAKQLNLELVRGPDGRPWGDTTIRGQAERGTGILNNSLCAGRLEWNRCSYVKDPRTGKRVARPNPTDKWEIVEVPHLRIIEENLWQQVKSRQAQVRFLIERDQHGNGLNRAHRRRFLLSGLLVCGSCGGGYTIVGPDRYGCATRRSKGTCSNALLIGRKEIEERVLGGLRERMMAPELVAVFVEEFNAELRRLASDVEADYAATHRAVAEVDRKIAGIVRAIEDGAYSLALKERLATLEKEKALASAKLAMAEPRPIVHLHPALPEIYRKKVEGLTSALNQPGTATEAGEIIRSLIDRIVLTPSAEGLKAEIFGDLVKLVQFTQPRDAKTRYAGLQRDPGLLSVVAGTRNRLDLLLLASAMRNAGRAFSRTALAWPLAAREEHDEIFFQIRAT